MRWTLVGAKSLLNLRATIASGHWDEFLAHRRATEIRQFHPHREAIANHLPVLTICEFAEVRLHPFVCVASIPVGGSVRIAKGRVC
jgi:hypothetical protein